MAVDRHAGRQHIPACAIPQGVAGDFRIPRIKANLVIDHIVPRVPECGLHLIRIAPVNPDTCHPIAKIITRAAACGDRDLMSSVQEQMHQSAPKKLGASPH